MSLGGLHDFHEKKNAARRDGGLPTLIEDPQEVCKHMRAASPPASAADLIEQSQQPRARTRTNKKVLSSLAENKACPRWSYRYISI